MPNNIEGRGLTDREMLQLCLELEKGRCRGVSNTLLETSHVELREIYQDCFQHASENQLKLYDKMHSKGWYIQSEASSKEIERVQEEMQNNLHPDEQF